jgi:hypothetical protein
MFNSLAATLAQFTLRCDPLSVAVSTMAPNVVLVGLLNAESPFIEFRWGQLWRPIVYHDVLQISDISD